MIATQLTSEQLEDSLRKTGRTASQRRLTNWRAKGLLPRLETRGNGQGLGRAQFWSDPNVFDRACIVYDALQRGVSTDRVLLILWFCGFAIPAGTVKPIWLTQLKRSRLRRKAEPGEFASDKFAIDIDEHGIRIRIDRNTLLVRNGFTHYPQKPQEIRYFPGDANLPDRIIILDGSGGITFDALGWMSEQKIEFIRLDWRGEPISVGGNTGYSANPKLVEMQLQMRNTKREIEIARNLIREKLIASVRTLETVIPKSDAREMSISRIRHWASELQRSKYNSKQKLLGIEGPAARAYFEAFRGMTIKWTGLSRKPIPADWFEIGPRTMAWRKRALAPRHPVNAMLNYGYGILKSRVRTEIAAAGLDPTIGIMHGNSENRIPLVYDLMEPLRPSVDTVVLRFALDHEFSPGDFTISKWGGCRLNPRLVKAVVAQTVELESGPIVSALLTSLCFVPKKKSFRT